MPYATGSVLRVQINLRDTRFDSVYKNIMHFRVIEATETGAQLNSYVLAGSGGFHTWLGRFLSQLCVETYVSSLHFANLTDLTEPTYDKVLDAGAWSGAIGTDDDDVPQAAACVTRKSFLRGRQAIGHLYFGPLPSIFTSEGKIVPDPTGSGDLQDLLDGLGDPLIDGATGWTARPIVCNAAGTGVVANNDVRTQSIAENTVYLRSRRPGHGE